jgi:ribosome-binding protein aMBF1 (putative translation factor)
MAKTDDALEILRSLTKADPEVEEMVKASSLNAELAQLIFAARTRAGLTQKQLAEKIGTQQSVIARLEDADYEGHSLSMLQKIATALNQRLEVQLVEITSSQDYTEPRSA